MFNKLDNKNLNSTHAYVYTQKSKTVNNLEPHVLEYGYSNEQNFSSTSWFFVVTCITFYMTYFLRNSFIIKYK